MTLLIEQTNDVGELTRIRAALVDLGGRSSGRVKENCMGDIREIDQKIAALREVAAESERT
jgi:hypothetical protein